VNVGKGFGAKPAVSKSAAGLAAQLRTGAVQAERKHAAETSNRSAHTSTVMSASKLDNTEETRHKSSGKELGNAIMQARVAKKWGQKDLATAINEKAQVVQQYEQGAAIPNPQIINKLERALNCRLPRPNKPKPNAGAAGGRGGAPAQKGGRDAQGLTANQRAALTRGGPAARR
jgi:putative transcription factor